MSERALSEGSGNSSGQSAEPLMDLVRRLYPICRSITGDGVRQTLDIISESMPLDVREVESGSAAFDWTVPNEWNIRDAFIADLSGNRIVDFRDSSLHVVSYSVPVDATMSRSELDSHLYSLPDHPDRIPYRTSYYEPHWGFCLTQNQRDSLTDDKYRVVIDSSLEPGSLTYAECVLPGDSEDEILLYTHICHPSLCNDNLSGIAVMVALAKALDSRRRRFSYRLVFAPGTIGSIVWLSRNRENLGRIRCGLVLGLLGDDAAFTYKQTRDTAHEINAIAEYVLARDSRNRIMPFEPYGYDERQFGSPGIGLAVGRLTRSTNGAYNEYHSSADNVGLLSEARLQESVDTVLEILEIVEENRCYTNQEPFCEPQLGRRGLYRSTGGVELKDRESAMLWLLNQSDGTRSLLDIAGKSNLDFRTLVAVAEELERAKLLA